MLHFQMMKISSIYLFIIVQPEYTHSCTIYNTNNSQPPSGNEALCANVLIKNQRKTFFLILVPCT